MDIPEREQYVKVRLVDNPSPPPPYCYEQSEYAMHDLRCMIHGCQAKVYAPAGTHSICRAHFLSYLTWRRRKGPQMFMKYAGMTMEERDPLVAEWANTIRVEEAPTASAPKT
jgi:hypothetical protein